MACSSEAPLQSGNPFPTPSGGSASGSSATPSIVPGAGAGGGGASAGAGSLAGAAGSLGGDASLGGGGGSVSGAGGALGGGGGGGGGNAGSGAGPHSMPPIPDPRGIYGHPDPNTVYPTREGFTPWLIEEFNSPIDLDQDPIWTWSDTALGDGAARMVKDAISFSDGKMVITVSEGQQPGGYSHSAADNVGNRALKSGELRTIYNNFRYGRYEVRMKAPGSASNYIFTMFAYRTPAYLNWREIDIEVQASPTTSFISNLITAPPGTRLWNASIEEAARQYPFGGDAAAQAIPTGFDTQAEYHTYAFEWLPTTIKWFIDDKLVRVKKAGEGQNKLPIPELSTKIIMNLWIFPTADLGGGDPALNVYPFAGQYDWFRFYKWNQDTMYPCANTPACVSADDLKLSKNNPSDPLPDIRPELCTSMTGMLDVACGP
jgi:hypothetical protein